MRNSVNEVMNSEINRSESLLNHRKIDSTKNLDVSNYKAIKKYQFTEKCEYLENLIKYQLSRTCPLLSESENTRREKLEKESIEFNINSLDSLDLQKDISLLLQDNIKAKNNYNNDEDNKNIRNEDNANKVESDVKKNNSLTIINSIDTFWTNLKKKYQSFFEFKILPISLLREIYSKFIKYNQRYKAISKNFHFSYDAFLKTQMFKSVSDDWDKFIKKKLVKSGSSVMINEDGFWLNAVFDSNSSTSEEYTINDFIKYNFEVNSKSVIIAIELFYKNLCLDVYTLLNNKEDTTRLVLKIEQRSYYIGNNVTPIFYVQDDEWNKDINNLFNTVLSCLLKMNSVKAFSIVMEEDCHVELNKLNTILLAKLLNKFKDSLEILSLNRIRIPYFDSIYDDLFQNRSLKIFITQGTQFEFKQEDIKKNLINAGKLVDEEGSMKNDSQVSRVIYFRFNKECIYSL